MTDWPDARLAARLFAADPAGFGGIVIRARAGPVRDAWLAYLASLLPSPPRRMPVTIAEDRLLGGIDLSATLAAGRPIAQRGLLAESDGGVVIAAMAERLPESTAAQIAATLDAGLVRLERDGIARSMPARFGLVLLDEGANTDEGAPRSLVERAAFHLDLNDIAIAATREGDPLDIAAETPVEVEAAIETLCGIALALGVPSLRASIFAVSAARGHAGGRATLDQIDLAAAARLVLAPRATRFPAPPEADTEPERESEQRDQPDKDGDITPLTDIVLESARAAIPPDLLARLEAGGIARGASPGSGTGERRRSPGHGRRAGIRAGQPRHGARLDLIETLKAAAPWQRIRRRDPASAGRPGILVRTDDFRVRRFIKRAEATTIFVVDASGSAAIARLAETKGAVELLLAEAYIRRAQVALIAFRGSTADLLLPPTRSLARARRSLGDLAGGGGTPLAAALESAQALAEGEQRKGRTALIVLMTDGRANVARPGAANVADDTMAAARLLCAAGVNAIFLDTAQRPRAEGAALAVAMGARYVPLPRVEANAVANVVRAMES